MHIDTGLATLLVGILSVAAQIVTTFMMIHLKRATNGMKAELEQFKYNKGRQDQKDGNADTG